MDALFSRKTLGPVDHHHEPEKLTYKTRGARLASTLGKHALGLTSVVGHRLRRGGLGLLLRIVGAIVAIVVLINLIPSPLNGRKSPVPGWFKKKPVARGDDLRIVVFGSQDVAASALDGRPNGGSTWTHTLCKELKCGTRHSFVPEYSRGMGLTSKRRYEAELQSLKNLSKEANLTDNPAADYQFLTHQYPISLDAHDLEEQVFDYFHTDKANLPPQETVYVFTFGTWDVWNLAAMPLEKGERLVDELTSLIFNQTELLYTQSLDIQSIAHSGYWGASIDPKASKKDKDRAIKEAAQRRRFNVVVPELFDMSLTPGWQFRDLPQPPHAPSEHMRNSALLTTRWNDRIREQMERWVALGTRAPENMPPDFIPAGPPLGTVEEPTDLYPRRVAYLAETATRMVEVLTEEDMQQAGESDRTGRGRAPPYQKLRFQNTRMACAARSSLLKKLDYGPHANEATRDRCMRPDNHLFYEPFTFNQRAVDEVGRMVAKGVNKNLFGKEEKEDDGKGK